MTCLMLAERFVFYGVQCMKLGLMGEEKPISKVYPCVLSSVVLCFHSTTSPKIEVNLNARFNAPSFFALSAASSFLSSVFELQSSTFNSNLPSPFFPNRFTFGSSCGAERVMPP